MSDEDRNWGVRRVDGFGCLVGSRQPGGPPRLTREEAEEWCERLRRFRGPSAEFRVEKLPAPKDPVSHAVGLLEEAVALLKKAGVVR